MPFKFGHNRGPVWRARVDAAKAMLRECEISQTLPYARMTEILGREIKGSGDSALVRALHELKRDGLVFDNVASVGYKRADDVAIDVGAGRLTRKTFRAGKRALHHSRCADESKLPMQSRVSKWAREAALASVVRQTHGNSLRAAQSAPQQSEFEAERQRLAASLKPAL